eukprot:scaffold7065_cov117-Isochrysis_galbana.AAC.1
MVCEFAVPPVPPAKASSSGPGGQLPTSLAMPQFVVSPLQSVPGTSADAVSESAGHCCGTAAI